MKAFIHIVFYAFWFLGKCVFAFADSTHVESAASVRAITARENLRLHKNCIAHCATSKRNAKCMEQCTEAVKNRLRMHPNMPAELRRRVIDLISDSPAAKRRANLTPLTPKMREALRNGWKQHAPKIRTKVVHLPATPAKSPAPLRKIIWKRVQRASKASRDVPIHAVDIVRLHPPPPHTGKQRR